MKDFVIRGSSNGIYRNEEFLSATDVACPRKTILRHLEIQETINEKTQEIFKIGHLFEDWYAQKHPHYEREREIIAPGFKGHCDFSNGEEIVETKSCTSKNTYKEVFKQGKCKVQYVIQLACYMTMLEVPKGRLVFGSYVHIADYSKIQKMDIEDIQPLFANAEPELKEFIVTINTDGMVLVDGEIFYGINITEILAFQSELHRFVKQDELPPRVQSIDPSGKINPCQYCKLSYLCEKGVYELDDFIKESQDVLDNQI